MRILLVRLRLIGDVVFTTPAIRAVRRRFPDGHLAYLVEPDAAPVVAGNPHLDEVIVTERRKGLAGLRADLALVSKLRAGRYDIAIDFHGGPRSSLLTALSAAPMRIGYRMPGRTWRYTHRVQRSRDLRPRHSVLNQWDLLSPLGIGAPDPATDATEMHELPEAAGRVAQWLSAAGFAEPASLIVVHVSAGNPFRRWPVAAFAELTARLLEAAAGRWVAVTSGPSDMQAAALVCHDARSRVAPGAAARILHASELGLADLRALIGRATLFIGGDSGPMHIAGTTTTPIVALYGPTLRERSEPWRNKSLVAEAVELRHLACRPCDQRECVTGDVRCLAAIPATAVCEAAERAMARQERRLAMEKQS